MNNKLIKRNEEIRDLFLSEKNSAEAIKRISEKFGIDKSYVRSILKSFKINVGRKSTYDRSDRKELTERDSMIINDFRGNMPLDEISKKYTITPTRIRQIVRRSLGSLKANKETLLAAELEKINADIAAGLSYDVIKSKYSRKVIRNLQMNMGLNLFKIFSDRREADIVAEAKKNVQAKDIAAKHNITLNYTYMILHKNGIKFKISKEDKERRDEKIERERASGTPIEKIANKYKLTPTMVRIILSGRKNKK